MISANRFSLIGNHGHWRWWGPSASSFAVIRAPPCLGTGQIPQGRACRMPEPCPRAPARARAAAPGSAAVPGGQPARSAGTNPARPCCADGLRSFHHGTRMRRRNGGAIHPACAPPRHNARACAPVVGRAAPRSDRWRLRARSRTHTTARPGTNGTNRQSGFVLTTRIVLGPATRSR